MGLDTSHDCWHGSYGSFSRWRAALATAAGYGLETSTTGLELPALPWDSFPAGNYQGEWETAPADPLLYLFVHSDCDGVIHPEQGLALARRLGELLPELDPEREYPCYAEKTVQFIAGLAEAAEAGEDVDFH